jgi:hypothetical protein
VSEPTHETNADPPNGTAPIDPDLTLGAPEAPRDEPPHARPGRREPAHERLVVSRGDRFDVAEWGPGAPLWLGAAPMTPPSAGRWASTLFALAASILVVASTVLLVRSQRPKTLLKPLVATVADVQAVHARVTAGGAPVHKVRRVSAGEVVETDAEGRARLRLDDGTTLVIDRATKLTLTAKGLSLAHGRVFVMGAPGARAEVDVGGATAVVISANAGIERKESRARIYVATEEVTVRATGGEQTVRAGDTASVDGGKVTVAPERGFDDWTGGMAAPWGADGAPRRAVGELWGRPASNPTGSAGSPLTIRAHDVRAAVRRELAETEVRTTFFNAGSETVTGDFRMAVPSNAIVSRFAVVRGDVVAEGRVALAARRHAGTTTSSEVLEWAGEGWVRGTVPQIAAGATVTLVVTYVEWLAPRPKGEGQNLVVQYRYPMVSGASPPLVGEFSARVDATESSPVSIASGLGAAVSGQAVDVKRSDFRPTADLVVDVEIEPFEAPARLYVAPPTGDDDAGGTVVVRTEAPRAKKGEGVTLALVLDVSGSIEPALLDAERALVEAVLQGLGADDKLVVLAADQTIHPVGPAAMGPADAARKKAISEALAKLASGGATDIGRALEAGADALPADAPAAMVIYVGDGWPTVGDPGVQAMLARLSRRSNGTPRLGAVAVGPVVNRYALAALVRGSGPLFEIADSSDAARTAIALLSEALQPTIADVEIGFGPEVERVYPRGPRAAIAGDTVTAVGRVRGAPPTEITLRWRDAQGAHVEKRPLVAMRGPQPQELVRRWAAARVEEIALHGKGREAATDVALRAGLLTPWTGWLTGGGDSYVPTSLATRVLDLALSPEAGFSAAFATPRGAFGTLANAIHETDDAPEDANEDAYKRGVSRAAGRVILDTSGAVRQCRDIRAAHRPELTGRLAVTLDVDGEGRASDVRVRGEQGAEDEALARCVQVIIEGLELPASGLKVKIKVAQSIELPRVRGTLRGRKCSATSTLPTPLRRGVWRERLDQGRDAGSVARLYLDAKDTCELPTWTDRRSLLELVLDESPDWSFRVSLAQELERAGEADAAGLLRREAVRRARTPDELRAIQSVLVGDESYPRGVFKKQYGAAKTDAARLAVVRRFLVIAPHDARLRRRLFALLEAMGMKQELADEVRRVRRDPFADAGLLADGAAALRRIGDEGEALRAFGELAERAPEDAWARAFVGDRLRNEGWFEDATRSYAVLEQLLPDDPGAILRLSLAHAGSGRLDIAGRMLSRVAQTGGRSADARLGELAGRLARALYAEARQRKGVTADDADRLTRALLELPGAPGATVFLVRGPAGSQTLTTTLVRGPKDAREERVPDAAAPGAGLYSHQLDPGDGGDVVLRMKRPGELAPARGTKVRVDALVPDGEGKPPRLVTAEAELPITGKPVELRFADGKFASD